VSATAEGARETRRSIGDREKLSVRTEQTVATTANANSALRTKTLPSECACLKYTNSHNQMCIEIVPPCPRFRLGGPRFTMGFSAQNHHHFTVDCDSAHFCSPPAPAGFEAEWAGNELFKMRQTNPIQTITKNTATMCESNPYAEKPALLKWLCPQKRTHFPAAVQPHVHRTLKIVQTKPISRRGRFLATDSTSHLYDEISALLQMALPPKPNPFFATLPCQYTQTTAFQFPLCHPTFSNASPD
jgi:hypothetical protein